MGNLKISHLIQKFDKETPNLALFDIFIYNVQAMLAIFKTGGKQYKALENTRLKVERLPANAGETVRFDDVKLVCDGSQTILDSEQLKKAHVEAIIVVHFRGPKIVILKKKRRKNYRRKLGHRQDLSLIEVKKIVVGG